MSKNETKARATVAAALDAAFVRAQKQEKEENKLVLDIKSAKYIIFSDHHKGNRDGADDFRVCERAYNAALAYYYNLGYTLVVLGDVEELWEEQPKTVMEKYAHTQALEGKFHQAGRYLRVWGNHDDVWSHPDLVKKVLIPALGGGHLDVRESLILHVWDGDKELGRFFLTHGHQGTLESDRIAPISKWFVRNVWRPIQRIIKISLNTPAKDYRLSHAHDSAMYTWSESQEKVVLVTGHTHRPVFMSKNHEAVIREEIDEIKKKLANYPNNLIYQMKAAGLAAKLEWILTQNQGAPVNLPVIELKKPSYFNTGCCAFLDGDVTGLEISEGKIQLVRWPDDDGNPKPKVLGNSTKKLKDVFAAC